MSKPLLPGDVCFILLCILVCAVSLFIGTSYFYRAFPEASIDFRVDRLSSLPVAENFLLSQGIGTAGYLHASVFQYDNQSKVFLERELGLDRANDLLKNEVKLWRWKHRWFRPKQKEEIRAEISTSGQVAAFSHLLPESAMGADLPPDAALALAESFLALEMKLSIDSLEYVDVKSEKRANRTDHVLTWEVRGLDLKQASYRISVTVQGDKIGGYREFLKIPDEWSRGYARLRSLNETATQFDLIFVVLIGAGMIVVFGRQVRLRDVRWKTALAFAIICFVLQFSAAMNEYPSAKYEFNTASTYGLFLSRLVLLSLLNASVYAGIIFFLTASAEPAYRRAFPGHLSISRMFSRRAVRTRSFFIGSLAGITLTFFFFAYEIGFYLLANKFGAWAPADVPYSDLLNTKVPWIFVLLGGFFPAVSEEWTFRAFSIPFLQNLLSHRWVAVLLASFIWGFGHAGYPNQPFFIRGIEVGIIGLVLSWAMFRFGILAPLIAHYSIDAFYSAFLLLRSGNAYLMTSGAVTAGIFMLPLLIAAGSCLFKRRFRDESDVSNASEGTARPLTPATPSREDIPTPAYKRLSRGRTAWAFGILAAGIVSIMSLAPRFADEVRFRITASEAVQSARSFLAGLGFNPEGYETAAQPQNRVDSTASQYIYSKKGIQGLDSVYGPQKAPLVWEARFYRPLQKEEYRVSLDPVDGNIAAFHHSLSEDAPGADLPVPGAERIASSFISDRGYELSRYRLSETASEKRARRRDTSFVWEALPGTRGAIEEARLRLQAAVYGDKVGNWDQSVKLPEEWKRERESRDPLNTAILAIRTAFIIVILAWAVLTLIRGTRRGLVRWRIAGGITAAVLVLELLNVLNRIPLLRFQYDTQIDMNVFLMTSLAGEAVLLIGIGLAAAAAAALVMACYPEAPAVLRNSGRIAWGRDAAICAAATVGAYFVLQWLVSEMKYHVHDLMIVPALSIPTGIGSYIPFISDLRNVVLGTLFFAAVAAFATCVWRRLAGRPAMRAVLLGGTLLSLVPASARGIAEVAVEAIPALLLLATAGVLAAVFLRNNYLSFPVCAAALSVARISLSTWSRGNEGLFIQTGLMWLLLLTLLSFLIFRGRTDGSPSGSGG